MSPRFEPDLGAVRATTRIFDSGEYVLKIGDAYPISYTREKDGAEIGGARYALEMVGRIQADGSLDDAHAGESVTANRVYIHSEGALSMAKRFLMAAFGYSRNDEESFNEEVLSSGDFSISGEGDEAELGSSWAQCSGNLVRVSLDKDTYEGEEQQAFRGWSPWS
jgi:hypothetical protein